MTTRDARLAGIAAAQRLHRSLGSKGLFDDGVTRVDVFGAALKLDVILLFRPLDGLLGAFLNDPAPGILVSTRRPLHVQRFTAAHELGHFLLKHQPSVDEEVGFWRSGTMTTQELGADTFASEFLLPKWLLAQHAARQRWKAVDLQDPRRVYQLSLRTGTSYEATCWALVSHGALSKQSASKLTTVSPKELKQAALHGIAMTDPWANVWSVSEHDHNLLIEGGPNDLFAFRLTEHSAGGYLWDKSQLEDIGLEVLADERVSAAEDHVGSPTERLLVARVPEPGRYRVHIDERRPWLEAAPNTELELDLELNGKEEGLSRSQRKAFLASA